uniref:Uncharacterized protein n=1 Tax=Ditylenchus dipsaci TaxID=166011 RepID=A0A915EH42_9BILA
MPAMMRSLVHYTIRKYFDLSIAKYVHKYSGPLLFIRRWDDEIIITEDLMDATGRRASNRANELLISFLGARYPGLLQKKADEDHVREWLELDPQSRIISFNTSEPKIPKNLMEASQDRRLVLIEQLCNKHFVDFEASHNVPLASLFFNIPAAVVIAEEMVKESKS